jgi:outer membrane lipopolysaccharide assembly protein LptE/RlpB
MRGEHGRLSAQGNGAVKCAWPLALLTRSCLTCIVLVLSACGYHTAGKGNILPDHVKTIAIPAFVNETQSYKLEQMLTGAVVREFTTRANYRVIPNADDDTDAILRGTVLSAATAPSTYDANTGRVASVLVTVNMKVALTGRDGKVLYANEQYQFREQYQVAQGFASFFQEDSPALQRLSQDFARTLVSNILEGF